jgi:hypothetical protein
MRSALKTLRGVCIAVALTMGGSAYAACPAGSSIKDWVQGGKLCFAAATYGTEAAGSSPVLVVVLHGDTSSGGPADYHFDFARSIVQPGLVAVALLRPGYSDRAGRTSEGQDLGRRDSYTADYIGAVGSAIDALKNEYRANRVVLRRLGLCRRALGIAAGYCERRDSRLLPMQRAALARAARKRCVDAQSIPIQFRGEDSAGGNAGRNYRRKR